MACSDNEDTVAKCYIPAIDAVEFLALHVGSRFQARNMIIDAMHAGDITTTAEILWEIDEAEPTEEWSTITKGAKIFARNVELPRDYWHGSYHWPSETHHWRWEDGNFILNGSAFLDGPLVGDALENVMFEEQEVHALLGSSNRKGIGGRKTDKEKWAEFWISIIYETSGTTFDWRKFKSKNALKEFMLDECNEDLFADSSVAFAVDLAWERLAKRVEREREAWGEE